MDRVKGKVDPECVSSGRYHVLDMYVLKLFSMSILGKILGTGTQCKRLLTLQHCCPFGEKNLHQSIDFEVDRKFSKTLA